MQRFFIEDQSMVENMLLNLTPIESDSIDDLLLDESTGQQWDKYMFELEDRDGLGLRVYPYLSIEGIIALALTTPHMDEVGGAMALLHHLESTAGLNFRSLLLDKVEESGSSIGLERYTIIYDRAELYSIDNRREILGKHYQEVKEDAAYFAQLALRAGAIRTQIQRRG